MKVEKKTKYECCSGTPATVYTVKKKKKNKKYAWNIYKYADEYLHYNEHKYHWHFENKQQQPTQKNMNFS